MPRRKEINKRKLPGDPVYNSGLVTRTINYMMRDGKKSLSEQIFYGAMDIIKEKTGEDPLRVFNKAVENVKPMVEVKSRRVGGSTYQVPVDVRPDRRVSLALRWLVNNSRTRPGRTMEEKLASELMDAHNNTGVTIKKKEDTHRMAEANKAFAHYRW